jgi:hypothetical protein
MEEKRMQKALLRWGDPASRPLVEKALRRIGRLRPGERLGPGMRPVSGRRPGGGGRPARRAPARPGRAAPVTTATAVG